MPVEGVREHLLLNGHARREACVRDTPLDIGVEIQFGKFHRLLFLSLEIRDAARCTRRALRSAFGAARLTRRAMLGTGAERGPQAMRGQLSQGNYISFTGL
jgi:hypothetical protein